MQIGLTWAELQNFGEGSRPFQKSRLPAVDRYNHVSALEFSYVLRKTRNSIAHPFSFWGCNQTMPGLRAVSEITVLYTRYFMSNLLGIYSVLHVNAGRPRFCISKSMWWSWNNNSKHNFFYIFTYRTEMSVIKFELRSISVPEIQTSGVKLGLFHNG